MGLVHFDKARQELTLAKNIDEVKNIRDRAEALRAYAKQAGESLDMQNMIIAIKGLPCVSFTELSLLPQSKGIYFIIDDSDILYVGMSRNIKKRLITHTRRTLIQENNGFSKVHWLLLENDGERQRLEYLLIKAIKPKYDRYRQFSDKPPSQKFIDIFDIFLNSIIEHKNFDMEAILNGK